MMSSNSPADSDAATPCHSELNPSLPSSSSSSSSLSTGTGCAEDAAAALPGAPDPPLPPPRKKAGAHTRSASHMGILLHNQKNNNTANNIEAEQDDLKHHLQSSSSEPRIKQHQRAFSHGTGVDARGHKREGSRTDFILPEGHEEREREREQRGGRPLKNSSAGSSWTKSHKRQASHTDSVYSIRNQKKTLRQKLCFWRKTNHERSSRLVVPNYLVSESIKNGSHPNYSYARNKICTRKYTFLTFLPKNLFEQFHRFANLYFLFIVLLNFVPAVNAFAPELSMLPLIFVLGVTAIKDIFEDYRRYVNDKDVNNSTCRVYSGRDGRYIQKQWKEVCVGDILHLSCDEIVPADMVLINASDEHGVCYIESSNLDGEINLKQRQSVKIMDDNFSISKLRCTFEVGPPSTKMYHFVGTIMKTDRVQASLTKDNFIPRDCVIKNTDFVEGIVVYAGHETKAMLNNGGPRYKRSKLERQMNREVLWCVVILIVMCILSATGSGFWQSKFFDDSNVGYVPFIIPDPSADPNILQSPGMVAFTSFWSFIIVYQIMIPISLYVTIEIIKLMQVYHIQSDEHFYDKETGKSIKCRALNVNEELGQVQYIFADKTGTLTENNMVFQRCSINGIDYPHEALMKNYSEPRAESFSINSDLQDEVGSIENQFFYAQRMAKGAIRPPLKEEHRKITDFFITLAACNTVVVSKFQHRDTLTATGAVVQPEPQRESRSHSPLPFSLPSLGKPKKVLLRSLFPGSRPLSPIAASPCPTPSVTPTDSPRHSTVSAAAINQTSEYSNELMPPFYNGSLQLPLNSNTAVRPTSVPFAPYDERSSLESITPVDRDYKPFYEAESPDELALVDAAYMYGYRLLRRNFRNILLFIPGTGLCQMEVLHSLPFDSNRKRMSVIVNHPETGEKTLFCKGADSAILDYLKPTTDPLISSERSILKQHLDTYSKRGLRVMCMAKRSLSDSLYEEWLTKYNEAANSLVNREKKLHDTYCDIESNFSLLGATGIEDRLQDGVPETILSLRKAGIVIYVLTGDKQETAINIAYSCSLFSSDMDILRLNGRSLDETKQVLTSFLKSVERQEEEWAASTEANYTNENLQDEVPRPRILKPRPRGLVVDGRTLVYILDERTNLKTPFLKLSQYCRTVLCCRMTPLQKALIVRNVKDKIKALTLAVGDGANDVSMIQTADVGVGISGVEGRQAVMASDFAIARFRHLEKLLLVHGHWSYDRLARIILYFFYKNASVVFILMWYQLYCGFSGTVVIEQLYLSMFSLLFTSLPPVVVGIYNKDADEEILLSQPKLYAQGRLSQVYKPNSFWINIIDAFYQSIAILFISVLAYSKNETGVYELGMTITHTCLITQLLHLAIETSSWTALEMSGFAISYVIYFLFGVGYTVVGNGSFFNLASQRGEFSHMLTTSTHWFTLFLATVVALFPRFLLKAIKNSYFPTQVVKTVIENGAKNRGLFTQTNSKASSTSSVYRFDCQPHTEGDTSGIDPLSSLVTMTTIISNQGDTEA